MIRPKAPNLLQESGLAIAYPVARGDAPPPPDPAPFGIGLSTAVRSLTVMQKETIVSRSDRDVAWRLASDEGPYLQGHDFAPAPLAYLVTGLAADLYACIDSGLHAADAGRLSRMVLDSRFTMEGSLPRGTMTGGALAPQIKAVVTSTDHSAATGAVMTGVVASAGAALAAMPLVSRFSLTSHGSVRSPGRVAALDEPPPPEHTRPGRFPGPRNGGSGDSIIIKTADIGDAPDAGSSLQAEQRRELHLRAAAFSRDDGLTEVEVTVHRPLGSTFRFLVAAPDAADNPRAPDALSYLSAGIGMCFMTQIGRYAKILRRDLGDYHILQHTRFTPGDQAADPPRPGSADAPRTHVYLAPDDEEFAVHALDMSEQTCFVHAMCRADLRPKVTVLPG